jgi:SNF2 family DNA or RNA helicase
VVLDEAQAIKNATTLVSTTARSLKGRYRIAMTGTPVENSANDLWALMDFLIPGYLGSIQRFKRLYAPSRDTGGVGQNINVLKRLVQPFLLRRTKASVLKDLPEKIEQVVECEMTQPQRKEYAAWLNSEDVAQARQALEAGGKVNYAHVLAMLTRLKQICDHPGLPGVASIKNGAAELDPTQSGKWEAFEELLGEALGSNLKVVVFTQYLGMMDLIGKNLLERGIGYTELRGDTQDRGVRLDRFARDPNCKVFVCSLLAGGLGIDLTSASVCVHFDRWWNPARENQATDRLHRFGQTRGVQVFKLQIPGTVEDRIARILESKVALSDALIEESGAGLKSFSRKELLELLTLAPSGSLGEEQAQKAAAMVSEG